MEQKRKVKSLISVSETGEMGIFSKFLIALSCIFCFGTILMLALCVSYVDAANPLYSLYSGGVEERSETLYRLDFTKSGSLDIPEAHIYMKSNAGGKNNLYIEPYPIMVKYWGPSGITSIGQIGGEGNLYLNFLGGDGLEISSPNISIIGGYKLTVESNNSNATILGGRQNKIHSGSASSSVIVGGYKNNINGTNGVIVGGEGNEIFGNNSFLLGGESKSILEESSNVIAGGVGVYLPNGNQINNIFAYSNMGHFYPKSSNAFYIDVQKGLGLKMQAPGGVASSGAVSFGSVKSIGDCDNGNIGLMGLSGNCLYGCSEAGWQELGCFEEEWLTGDDENGACVGPVYDAAIGTQKKRYTLCFPTKVGNYQNVKFEASLWTGENCPAEPGIGKNPCVYRCADEYHYIEGEGCMKDCEVPWGGSKKHGELITGYKESEVKCGMTDNEAGCAGKRAVLKCKDGRRNYVSGGGGVPVYDSKGKILYTNSGCTTIKNECDTGVYQYTTIGIKNWIKGDPCTDHTVDEVNNTCKNGRTIYSGSCFKNHDLVKKDDGSICVTGEDTRDCRCKPKQQTGSCTSLPSNATGIKTWFIKTASGEKGEYLPKTISYVPYTGNDETECTFRCNTGYSPYKDGNKWKCGLDCKYNDVYYKNDEQITGYKAGSVQCPDRCETGYLTCQNGKWIGGKLECKTTDQLCKNAKFTGVIEHATCTSCTIYSGSLSGTCTTGNTLYDCICHYDETNGYYQFNSKKTKCVPATRAADCTGSRPEGDNVIWSEGTDTFIQTWSGGVWKWLPELVWSGGANKWLPEEYNFHYGEGVCGFRCDPNSTYFTGDNKCEGNECVDNDFGEDGSFYLYPNSNLGLKGHTKSVLFANLGEAEVSYAEGKVAKCIYFCDVCYDKVDNKCEPKSFTLTFNCKNSAGSWSSIGTQEFTYKEGEKVNMSCSDMPGYDFVGRSMVKNSSEADFRKGDSLTASNYNSCNSTNFYAVYECANGYAPDADGNCVLRDKVEYCGGDKPLGEGYLYGAEVFPQTLGSNGEYMPTKADMEWKYDANSSHLQPCKYSCDTSSSYEWKDGKCQKMVVLECTGKEPSNAVLVNGAGPEQENNINTLYNDNEARDYPCSWKCDKRGDNKYYYIGGECVHCEDGSYDADKGTCNVIPTCEEGYGLFKQDANNDWGYEWVCLLASYCINPYKNGVYKNGVPYSLQNWDDIRPFGGNKTASCKNNPADVHPNSCEFSCSAGYACPKGPSQMCAVVRCYGSIGTYQGMKIQQHPTWDTARVEDTFVDTYREYVSSEALIDQYIQQDEPGCYYWCPAENKKPYGGCYDLNDPVWSSDDGNTDINTNSCSNYKTSEGTEFNYLGGGWSNAISIVRPTGPTQRYEYVSKSRFSEIDNDPDIKGCYFTCKEGYSLEKNVSTAKGYQNDYYCWKQCNADQYFAYDGTCRKCPDGYEPDPDSMLKGNATDCRMIDCGEGATYSFDVHGCRTNKAVGGCPSDAWIYDVMRNMCVKCIDLSQHYDSESGECVN